MSKATRKWLIAGMIIGGLLMLSPLFGLVGTAVGLSRAFSVLGSQGIGDPEELSAAVGDTLFSTSIGLLLLPFGLVLFATCLVIFLMNRSKTSAPPLPRPSAPPLPSQKSSTDLHGDPSTGKR